MTRFTAASFNVKNLIGAEQEYYKFEKYTVEEHAWKKDWLADQLLSLDADIVGFQEIFDKRALQDVVDESNDRADELNAAAIPGRSKSYRKKAIFRKLKTEAYRGASLAFAPNANDGEPGQRRPGVAILSRLGFVGEPEIIQEITPVLEIPFGMMGGGGAAGDGGLFRLNRLSRPILKVKIPVGNKVITVFNCHLKSKLGEYPKQADGSLPPEVDLTRYDPVGRAMGSLKAAVRRMAEAWVLREAIVAELTRGNPVMVMGDFNDGEHAVSSEIIAGERPFKNYAWMRRHDAEGPNDRYTKEEAVEIKDAVEAVMLHSCERLFVQRSTRDLIYTAAFGGTFESIDQIYLSRHFVEGEDQIGEMEYFSVLNDHLTDGSHAEAPYNKLASDHGQIMAHLQVWDD